MTKFLKKSLLVRGLLLIMPLLFATGCAFFLAWDADRAADTAQDAARCAQTHNPGSEGAKAAGAAAAKAADNAKAANEALQDLKKSKADADFGRVFVAATAAAADADSAMEAASTVAGCAPQIAKRPDGKYQQDIFGSQKTGPHT